MCHHNLNVHNVIFWIFQCRTLNNFNKLSVIIVIKNKKLDNISNIMRKRQGVFTKKMYDLFFEMQLKLKTCQNLNLRFQKIISGTLYTCYIYILTTRAIEVTQLYIRCKFYPIKKNSFLQEFQFEIGIKTIRIKHSCRTKSVYVFYPTGS